MTSATWVQPKGLRPSVHAPWAQPPCMPMRAAAGVLRPMGPCNRRLTCCTSSHVEGKPTTAEPRSPSAGAHDPAETPPLDTATLIDGAGDVHVVSVIPLVTPSILENGSNGSRSSNGHIAASNGHQEDEPELVEGTWSSIPTDDTHLSDIPVVEAYVVDGMPATSRVRPSKSRSKEPSLEAEPDTSSTDPERPMTSARYAIVLLGQQKAKKPRSKGSKKMLKVLVKASTKFVDFVFNMPTMLVSNKHVLLGALVLSWYILGASLIGEAAGKLSTFSPETLQPPGFELVAAMAGITQAVSDTIMERFAYLFQGWTYANLVVKIPMVLAAAVPLVLALGLLYHKATGTPLEQALLKIHAVVHRQPGANMVNEKTLIGLVLLNLSFFIGMFIVAVLFGLVSDEVKRSFRIIRDGNFPMKTTGHILILNYNQHVVPLLRQLWYGQKYSEDTFFKRPVVILADKSKLDMDEEIAARLKIQSLDVYTRTGNPATTRDLAMVAAGGADTVIVLHPDSSTQEVAEAYKAAIAMALSVAGKVEKQNVVMQMPNELPPAYDFMRSFSKAATACAKRDEHLAPPAGLGSVARLQHAPVQAANVQVLQMPDGNFMDRFTCHAALQPGVFRVWLRILQQGPANVKLRVKNVPAAMSGKTFSDIRRSFRDCVVVGYCKGPDAVFDPVDSQVLQADDKLIMLSYVINPTPGHETNSVYLSAAKAASERMARPATYQVAPRKVIVAGWNVQELQDMLECFADAAPENSQITFILSKVPEDPSPPSRVGSVKFNYVQADHPTCLKALTDAGIKQADAVLLGLHEDLPAIEGDAMVLAGLLQVQDAVLSSGRATSPHVVARVQRFGTMQVINQYYASLNVLDGRSNEQDSSAAKPGPSYAPLERVKTKFESFGTIPTEVREQAAAEALLACNLAVAGSTPSGAPGAATDAGVVAASGSAQQQKQAAVVREEAKLPPAVPPVPVNTGSKLMDNLIHNWTATFALTSNVSMYEEDVMIATATAAATTAKAATTCPAPAASKAAASASAATSNGSGSSSNSSHGNGSSSHGTTNGSNGSTDQPTTAVQAPSMPNPISMAVNAFTKPAEQPASSQGAAAVSGNGSATVSSGKDSSGTASTAPSTNNASSASSGSTSSSTSSAAATSSTAGSASAATAPVSSSTGPSSSTGAAASSSSSAAVAAKPKAPAPPCPIIRDPEVFLSDDISAALLTLVAAHPDVTSLIRKLLTTRQGVELYLRTPALFNLNPGERVTFAEVAEVARLLKQTALGYLKSDGSIILVPEPEHVFTYQEGDQIIVFADDFKKRTSGWGR